MAVIRKKLTLVGRRGRRRVEALFDSGSTHSMVRESIALAIAEPDDLPEPKRFEAAVGSFVARTGIFADVILGGKRLLSGLTVVRDLTEDVVLGCDFLIRLDPRRRRVVLDRKAMRLKAVGSRHRP